MDIVYIVWDAELPSRSASQFLGLGVMSIVDAVSYCWPTFHISESVFAAGAAPNPWIRNYMPIDVDVDVDVDSYSYETHPQQEQVDAIEIEQKTSAVITSPLH